MGKNVFANGKEISAKASSNRSIAAMPDVCLSPPGPPAGPIPIPYPNTAVSSNTSGGSRTVKIGGQEVGKKNASEYSKSTGDEPATRSFGMGVGSHNLTGPMKFAAWSMDVKAEGANVTRFMDLTTHNHSNMCNTPPTVNNGGAAKLEVDEECVELAQKNEDARKDKSIPSNQTVSHGRFRQGESAPIDYKACSKGQPGADWATGVSTQVDRAKVLAEPGVQEFLNITPGKSKSGIDRQSHGTLACFGKTEKTPHDYKSFESMTPNYPAHAEPKIIDEIFKKALLSGGNANGGQLLLNINWPNGPKKNLTTRSPCEESCSPLICAIEAAGCLDIWICDEHNQKKKPDCDD
ncbi:DUF4150 domain-containing protein [Roseateles chitinivorans]|uniref:DUF4150 domain-containing protein n=1 Tax=Roseateles chitinivorans TaxID=2917965 RepID=UPI003D674E18